MSCFHVCNLHFFCVLRVQLGQHVYICRVCQGCGLSEPPTPSSVQKIVADASAERKVPRLLKGGPLVGLVALSNSMFPGIPKIFPISKHAVVCFLKELFPR